MKEATADPQEQQRAAERAFAAEVMADLDGAAVSVEALLEALQERLGYVPPPAIPLVAARTGLERYDVYQLVEHSPTLGLDPPGRHRVAICRGVNCSEKGSARLGEHAERLLGIAFRHVTSDHAVRLDPFLCLGKCAKGPNVRIDDTIHHHVDEAKLDRLLAGLRES